jgi:hypothetical protein
MELMPIAYDPHGGEDANSARKVIERIDARDTKGALAAMSVEQTAEASP